MAHLRSVSDLKEDLKEEVLAARELATRQQQEQGRLLAQRLEAAEREEKEEREKDRDNKERRRVAAQNLRI